MQLTSTMLKMRKDGSGYDAIAKATGCAKTTLRSAFRKLEKEGAQGAPSAPPPATPKKQQQPASRTLEDFRREHDQTWKIRDGLKRLFSGQVIMTDAEFREAVSGNPSRWRAAADHPDFRENRYRVAGEFLWASKETIREMRKIKGEAI